MVKTSADCGTSCLSQSTDPATLPTCVTECLKKNTTPSLSDGCTGCYVADVGCSVANCLATCAAGSTPDCAACRVEKGCAAAFYTCSGLPLPTASGGSGGASSTGGASSGGSTSGGHTSQGGAGAGAPGSAGEGPMSGAGQTAGGNGGAGGI
jgi:hypothetical protein